MSKLFWEYRISGDTAEHAAYGVGPATDYATPMRTPVVAPFAGHVSHSWTRDGGNTIRVDGAKYIFVGQHLDAFVAGNGANVAHRQEIALTGNTGAKTTGPHIHCYIIVKATAKRISFYEWLRDYVRKAPSKPAAPAPTVSQPKGATVKLTTGWYYYFQLENALGGNYDRNQMLPAGTYKVVKKDQRGPVLVESKHGRVWIGTRKTFPKIEGAAPASNNALGTLDFGKEQWFHYKTAGDAEAGRNPQRGHGMLSGAYKVLEVSKRGAYRVHSNANGRVWVHPKAKAHLR